jgi:hypothetical protein
MTLTADQILSAVEKLDILEREALFAQLLLKYPRPDQAEFDAACAAESRRVYEEHQKDPSQSRDAFEALDALEKRLTSESHRKAAS